MPAGVETGASLSFRCRPMSIWPVACLNPAPDAPAGGGQTPDGSPSRLDQLDILSEQLVHEPGELDPVGVGPGGEITLDLLVETHGSRNTALGL